jgi:hypothetical protein
MPKFQVPSERVVQICAAIAAFLFLVSSVVYLYLGRWTVNAPGLLGDLRLLLESHVARDRAA